MPCRRGCPPPGPARLVQCRCAARGLPGSAGLRCKRDTLCCTKDTCANPQFCLTFKPEYCPNVVAATQQHEENFGYQREEQRRPTPPYHEKQPPWLTSPPQSAHRHSPQSGHSTLTHPYHTWHPPPPRSPSPQTSPTSSDHSMHYTPQSRRLSGTSQNPAYPPRESTPYTKSENSARYGGPPSSTLLDDNTCQLRTNSTLDHSNRHSILEGRSYPTPEAVRGSWGSERARAQSSYEQQRAGSKPIKTRCNENQQYPLDETNKQPAARCECRMPPAFAHLSCTGNLDGFCGCNDCEHHTRIKK